MHRTQGDGFIIDPVGLFPVFADESPPTRDATQVRHEEANSWQEEICNVILSEGFALNADSESIQQMIQLNTAIDKKDTDLQTSILAVVSLLGSDDITNDSFVSGTTTTDALEELWNKIDGLDIVVSGLDSDDIDNASTVSGLRVTNALDALKFTIDNIAASDVSNDSAVSGSTVRDALTNLNTQQTELPIVTRGTFDVSWSGVAHANSTIAWRKEEYSNDGRSKVTLFLPDIDTLTQAGSGISPVYMQTLDADGVPLAIRPPEPSNTFMPLFFGHGDAGTHRKQMSGGIHLYTNNATNKRQLHFCSPEASLAYYWDHGLADSSYLTLDRCVTEYWL